MDKKKVLIIGSGGREHALGWKLKHSPKVAQIYFASGNGGTADVGENIQIDPQSNKELLKFAKKNNINLTVVGPEASLATGIVDLFHKHQLAIFGPTLKAARLETSKSYAVKFMKKYSIPHPDSVIFSDPRKAKKYLISHFKKNKVIKGDGLALGKAVFLPQNLSQALKAVDDLMVKKVFGNAGNKIVIQERLTGFEVSIVAICAGKNYLLLPFSEDHKQVFDFDRGPNTGGMGVVAPHPLVTKNLTKRIEKEIIKPVIDAMAKEGIIYRGTLYPGIMVTSNGPKVLEFNARFGDPETEALLPLLSPKLDFYSVLEAAAIGKLKNKGIYPTLNKTCVVVALASGGYPLKYTSGKVISGLEKVADQKNLFIFHAATKKTPQGEYLTSGGRVLMVTGIGNDIKSARKKVYTAITKNIKFSKMHYRKDIGMRKRK